MVVTGEIQFSSERSRTIRSVLMHRSIFASDCTGDTQVHTIICETAGRYTPNLYSRFYEVDRQWSFSYVWLCTLKHLFVKKQREIRSCRHLLVCIHPKLNVRQKQNVPVLVNEIIGEPPFVCRVKTKFLILTSPTNSTTMVLLK